MHSLEAWRFLLAGVAIPPIAMRRHGPRRDPTGFSTWHGVPPLVLGPIPKARPPAVPPQCRQSPPNVTFVTAGKTRPRLGFLSRKTPHGKMKTPPLRTPP